MQLAVESSVSEPSPRSQGNFSQWPGQALHSCSGLEGPEECKWAEVSMFLQIPRIQQVRPCAHMLAGCPEGASPAVGSRGHLFFAPNNTGSKTHLSTQWGIFQTKALLSILFSGHCESGSAEGTAGRPSTLSREKVNLDVLWVVTQRSLQLQS